MTDPFPPLADLHRAVAPLLLGPVDAERALRAFAAAFWSAVAEPGDGDAGTLIAALGVEDALRVVASGQAMREAAGASGLAHDRLAQARERWLPRLDVRPVLAALAAAGRTGVSLLTPGDPSWPHRLDDLGAHAPVCLWVRGDAGALTAGAPAVALVGARAASAYGEHVAMELSAELARRGVAVISGAAYGIDGAAHRAALAAGGITVALLAGGVDRPYPAGHTTLLDRIAASGAVVGEVPCGAAPTKWRFLQRNRLIAALADATVVVEAGRRSGSLNTAGHAAELGRPLGAVPGPITSAASVGCHRLLREFDARCVTSADEVVELFADPSPALFDEGVGDSDAVALGCRTDDRTRLADALSSRVARDVDDIARRSGVAPRRIEELLGLLALEGTVTRDLAGWRLVPRCA